MNKKPKKAKEFSKEDFCKERMQCDNSCHANCCSDTCEVNELFDYLDCKGFKIQPIAKEIEDIEVDEHLTVKKPETCFNCTYYMETYLSEDDSRGVCRFNAPTAFVRQRSDINELDIKTIFPKIYGHEDFCGQWKEE